MSAEATFWAWSQAGVHGNNKLVLLCYADYANDKGFSWPGKGTVSLKCGVAKSTVKRCVSWLVSEGYLIESGSAVTSTEDKKSRETTRYKLPIPSSCLPKSTGSKVDPVQNEPGSNDIKPDLSASGVKLNPVSENSQQDSCVQGDSSGGDTNPVQNEPGSICKASGSEVNPNPTISNNKTYKGLSLAALDERLDVSIVKQYIDYRSNLKTPLVQVVFDSILKTACQPSPENFDPNQILVFAMKKAWRDLSLDWVRNAITKTPGLLKELAPNAPKTDQPKSTSQPLWQKLGFGSLELMHEYSSLQADLKQLGWIKNPSEHEKKRISAAKARIEQIKPAQAEGVV